MSPDTTVDEREVEFYTRLADTWWDREGPFWPLHELNTLRTAWIRDTLCRAFSLDAARAKPLQGMKILDVGCGGGILSESMARLGATVTGIDVVEKNIRVADFHARSEGLSIDYRLCTAAELAETGARYDVVLNMEVVEHVADVSAFMHDCCRLTADSGAMFVATINRNSLSWLFAIFGAEYVLRWLPRGTHRWSWFRTPGEITALLADGGLSVRDAIGVTANPFNRRLRLTPRTSVNYMLFSTREE